MCVPVTWYSKKFFAKHRDDSSEEVLALGSDNVLMLADGNGDYTNALGLGLDASGFGMGQRGQRFAVVVDDGVATGVHVEGPGEFKVSAAEAVLETL